MQRKLGEADDDGIIGHGRGRGRGQLPDSSEEDEAEGGLTK